MNELSQINSRVWLDEKQCSIEEFRQHVDQYSPHDRYPLAREIAQNLPIYDGPSLLSKNGDFLDWQPVMAEWNNAFATGPGAIVIKQGYTDHTLLDRVTDVFNEIVMQEENEDAGSGDHFAAAGNNSRIWNSHAKLCIAAPELFARYNANELIRRASESWLGTGYQITTQANIVRPGGKAQTAHRDYHMGFQSNDALRFFRRVNTGCPRI